jgi:hypothetical protein
VNEVVIEDVEDDDSAPDTNLDDDPLVDTDDVTVDQLAGDQDDHDRAQLDVVQVAADNSTLAQTGSNRQTLPWAAWVLAVGLLAVLIARRRRGVLVDQEA